MINSATVFTSNTIILVGYLIDYAEYQNGCWSSISCFLTHLNSIHQRHFSIIMHLRQTKICDKIEYYSSTNSYWWNEVIILVRKFLSYKAVWYEARCIEYCNTYITFKRDHFLIFYRKRWWSCLCKSCRDKNKRTKAAQMGKDE